MSSTQDHLVLIAALVSLFPNVSRLTLRHFPFSDTLRITLVSSYISSTAESGLLFSGFSPFVAFLRATQVLALEHRPACEPLVFRFTRESAASDFDAETFWVLR